MKRSPAYQFANAAGLAQPQFAALCWRMRRGSPQVLLITSRDTKRWILPKGWQVAGCDGPASAAQEAWEEAGVTGQIHPVALGTYGYDKMLSQDVHLACSVTVFPLRVVALARRFPERKLRRRKWFDAEKAARKVAEPDLRALLGAVATGAIPLTA